MARKPHHPAAGETLEEIQTAADHLAEWIRSHLALVIGSIRRGALPFAEEKVPL